MRLLTRSDFDGLVCAVLLVEKGVVDEYKFVHPKDIQEGLVEVTSNDVLANIPHVPGCGLWFDHHSSEGLRQDLDNLDYEGKTESADSGAQVIWDYYGGVETFGERFLPLLEAVNKSDSGNLSFEEIVDPAGWILLSYIMDPRTGLGRFREFRISNYQLMEDMIQYCRIKTVDEIMEVPDVKERAKLYFEHQGPFETMLKQVSTINQNVIITNLIDEEIIYSGNRFHIYAIYPEQNIEIRVMWGKGKENVVFACGHSILNRTSKTNVGELMLEYSGGGHRKVGTCQVATEEWEAVLQKLIDRMKADG